MSNLRELVAKGPEHREPNKINWKSTKTMILESSVEQWSKREQVDLKCLSEWKEQIKELVVERISSLKEKIRSPRQKILNDPHVKDTLSRLHDDFLVPADKATNSVIVVRKNYHIETLIKEFLVLTPPISVPTPLISHQLTHLMKS